jgi:hypothetical protein
MSSSFSGSYCASTSAGALCMSLALDWNEFARIGVLRDSVV